MFANVSISKQIFRCVFRSVDEVLPKSILDSVQNILGLFGVIVVIAVANPYFLIPVSVLSILSFFMRNIYLKTSKDIKRLEGIGK